MVLIPNFDPILKIVNDEDDAQSEGGARSVATSETSEMLRDLRIPIKKLRSDRK